MCPRKEKHMCIRFYSRMPLVKGTTESSICSKFMLELHFHNGFLECARSSGLRSCFVSQVVLYFEKIRQTNWELITALLVCVQTHLGAQSRAKLNFFVVAVVRLGDLTLMQQCKAAPLSVTKHVLLLQCVTQDRPAAQPLLKAGQVSTAALGWMWMLCTTRFKWKDEGPFLFFVEWKQKIK